MVLNRFYTPARLCSILDLARGATMEIPLITSNPTLIEILDHGDSLTLFRNLPGQSYSTAEKDPILIISLLAYEAFDWQAREIMKCYNYPRFSARQKQWADRSGIYYSRGVV